MDTQGVQIERLFYTKKTFIKECTNFFEPMLSMPYFFVITMVHYEKGVD